MNLNTITTAPGAAIGADTDTLPAKVAQLPGQHEAESAPTAATGSVVTTVQRMVGTFANHGINSAMLMQLQHLQELAIAVQLQGKHLVHLDLFGYLAGEMDLTLAGCPSDQHWKATAQRMPSRCISIPRNGSPEAIRKVQAELADAIADLMALLEEPQP